ncbi:3'-5' exonuclease [Marinobacter salarius]|uniref:DNA polymerase III PolC-type n=1 Tax=Marinobacter salarius TaxID=1420917 RepID=A0A1W6KFZ2_9GAMM|nr:3'-5' exonuclease [Marinobacter salarius]ARM86338.1 DNA polymerase III PolC-type [Marinobacter salarius]
MGFPVEKIDDIKAAPDDYQLIQRVPWTKPDVTFPHHIHEPVGDEVSLVVLDTETTGFDRDEDSIIELGLVKALVSPSTGQVTSLIALASLYNDPGFPIPSLITDITGINDEMVQGHSVHADDIVEWFSDDPIVVAHNASFDRQMFESHFDGLDRLRWACSIKDIPWSELGFEGSKLEYLLLKRGFFYEGHRASVDCLALAYLLETVNKACRWLLESESRSQCKLEAVGCPFASKDVLKGRGYRWDGDAKVWHKMFNAGDVGQERDFLGQLYMNGGSKARVTDLSSRERYKQEA